MPKFGSIAMRVVPFIILPVIMNFPAVNYGFILVISFIHRVR